MLEADHGRHFDNFRFDRFTWYAFGGGLSDVDRMGDIHVVQQEQQTFQRVVLLERSVTIGAGSMTRALVV